VDVHSKEVEEDTTIVDGPAPFFFSSTFLTAFSFLSFSLVADFALRSSWSAFFAADEGMTNRLSIFAYLVFGPGGVSVEAIARPMKIAAWRGPRATLGVQAKIRRVQVGLVFD
jgi:hypothetical protein